MDLQGSSRIARIAGTFALLTTCLAASHGWSNQLFPGDYLPTYKRAAEQGERKAQYLLGLRYERGCPASPILLRRALVCEGGDARDAPCGVSLSVDLPTGAGRAT